MTATLRLANPTSIFLRFTLLVMSVLGFGNSASAMLIDRGGGMIYDDVLKITWLQDAYLPATENFGVSGIGYPAFMTWDTAQNWIGAMNTAGYKGYSDWRLPYMSVSAGSGPTNAVVACQTATEQECRDNEMGYMFFYNLGFAYNTNGTGTHTVGGVTINNIQFFDGFARPNGYWSATAFNARDPIYAWGFDFIGAQFVITATSGFPDLHRLSAWAVRDGDVIPEPATVALLGLGLAGLGWSRRRNAQGIAHYRRLRTP